MSRVHRGQIPLSAGCVLALQLAVATAGAQTLVDGLDNPAGLGAITTESTLLDETPLPSGVWQYHNALSHDGTDSIRSILPNRSASTLSSTVEGPAVISFWWKVSAVNNFDRLVFRTNNAVAAISGNQDWQHRSFQVDCGSQPLEWMFERLSSQPVGNGEAWIDELTVVPIPNSPALQGAVENFLYTMHSTDWTSSLLNGALNNNVAKSGPVDPGESSSMVFEIEGPAVVDFKWGMESDPDGTSEFVFEVNDQEYGYLGNTQSLGARSYEFGPGTHCLKFRFERDPSDNPDYVGLSEGYVDGLSVTTFGESLSLAEAVDRDTGVYSNAWTSQTTVTHDGSDAAMVEAPLPNVARRLYVKLPDEAGLLRFWSKTETDAGNGTLYVIVDNASALERSGDGEWELTEMNLSAGEDRVLEAIFFRTSDANASSPDTKVFLDGITFTPGINNFQPDLSIGPRGKSLKGAGIQNASGASQTAKVLAKARKPYGQYTIRSHNGSSSDLDEITLRGSWSTRHFDVLFVVTENGQRLNYTAALKAGLFTTVELDPKEAESHEIWVVRKQESTSRSHSVRVTGVSTKDPTKSDTVKTKLSVGK